MKRKPKVNKSENRFIALETDEDEDMEARVSTGDGSLKAKRSKSEKTLDFDIAVDDKSSECKAKVKSKALRTQFGIGLQNPKANEEDQCEPCGMRCGNNEDKARTEEGYKKIQVLQRVKKEGGNIDACTEDGRGKWKCISIAIDSGACDNVIPPEELPSYQDRIQETKASRNGDDFLSASGDVIPNYGELKIPVVTREMTTRGMVFQAAGVAKPLGSVKKMLQAGHRVVFDSEASYVLNKTTGETNILREEDGNFMLDVWVPPPNVAEAAGFPRQP